MFYLCLLKNYWLVCLPARRNPIPKRGKSASWLNKRKSTRRENPTGDLLIAYLTKVSRFVAILEVTEEAIVSEEQKWTEVIPVRVGAKIVKQLPIPSAIPMSSFLGKLSFLMKKICRFQVFGRPMLFVTSAVEI